MEREGSRPAEDSGMDARRRRSLAIGYESLLARRDTSTGLIAGNDLRANARFAIYALAQATPEARNQAKQTLHALLDQQYSSGPHVGGWPRTAGGAYKSDWANFITVDLTHIALRFGTALDGAMQDRLEAAFRRSLAGDAYKPDNPRNNHQANAITNKALVGQLLGRRDLVEEARGALEILARTQAMEGLGEWDSPVYWAVWVRALATLHALTGDADLHNKSGLLLELLLLDRAADYMAGGYYPGAHSRVYGGNIGDDLTGTLALDYLFWGDFDEPVLPTPLAELPYRPPGYIARFVAERGERVVNRERHADVIRRRRVVWNKTTTITREYALGGVVPYHARWHNLQHSWDLTIRMRDRRLWHTLFTKNPGDGYDITYDPADPYVGESPWQQIYPHEDALLALYDMPASHPYPFIIGAVPPVERIERRGPWLVLQEGGTLAALGIALPFALERRELAWHVHSEGRQNAVVVQAAPVAAFGGPDRFDTFADELAARGFDWDAEQRRLAYTTLAGERLELASDAPGSPDAERQVSRRCDGAEERFEFALFEGCGISHEGGVLRARAGDRVRVIDFNRWRATSEPVLP